MTVAPGAQAAPVAVGNLEEFFRDAVEAAMAENQVSVDSRTSHYLVSLLTLYARSEALYSGMPEGRGLRPLAFMLGDALDAESQEERLFALQRLGDVALFVAGFLAECLWRSPVGVDYYVRMGGGAYGCLARSAPASRRVRFNAPVFEELAAKFQDLVDVLTEVRNAAGSASDRDLLRNYELWRSTGSRRSARLLRRAGVIPFPGPDGAEVH